MKIPVLENTHLSNRENNLEEPSGAIAFGGPSTGATDDNSEALVKMEEFDNMVKEEVKIEDEDDYSQEGSEVNSFGSLQRTTEAPIVKIEECDNMINEEVKIENEDHYLQEGSEVKSFGSLQRTDDESALVMKIEECDNIIKEEVRIEDEGDCLQEGSEFNSFESLQNYGSAAALCDCKVEDTVNPLFNGSVDSSQLVVKKKKRGPKRKQFKKELISLFNSNDEMYHCAHCGYKAKNAQTMEYHRTTHTGEKPYECNFCDYKAGHPTTLRRHMRRHTGEKPHACNLCDYKAAQPTALITHMRCMHTGERPYSCDICAFRAHDRGSLDCHKLSHLRPDERPFACEVCGISFTRRRHLLRHAKSKHPDTHVSLEKRFSTKTKSRPTVNDFTGKLPRKSFKRNKPFRTKFTASDESFSSAEENELSTNFLVFSEDREYLPGQCITPLSFANILDRPRRSIVPPKKLDL